MLVIKCSWGYYASNTNYRAKIKQKSNSILKNAQHIEHFACESYGKLEKSDIDDCNVVGILSPNMAKAFALLHPPLLLRKLDGNGFSMSSTGLIWTCLTERKYRVKLGTEITIEYKEMLKEHLQINTRNFVSDVTIRIFRFNPEKGIDPWWWTKHWPPVHGHKFMFKKRKLISSNFIIWLSTAIIRGTNQYKDHTGVNIITQKAIEMWVRNPV